MGRLLLVYSVVDREGAYTDSSVHPPALTRQNLQNQGVQHIESN